MNGELKALIDLIKANKTKNVLEVLVLVDEYWKETTFSVLKDEWNKNMTFDQQRQFILKVQKEK